ncbi:MAG: DUF4870 domain-containing protein [Peptococcaceae bacterium]
MAKSSLGLEENVTGLLCYLLGFITGIVFLVLEKESDFVRFHALQSTITFGVLFVLSLFFRFIPFVGWAFNLIIFLLSLITWIICMIKAYQGEMFKLPFVGDIAAKQGP